MDDDGDPKAPDYRAHDVPPEERIDGIRVARVGEGGECHAALMVVVAALHQDVHLEPEGATEIVDLVLRDRVDAAADPGQPAQEHDDPVPALRPCAVTGA